MTIFRKNQVLHIADKNVWELFFAYILVCWSYENGKNLPALLNLTKSVNVVHPTEQRLFSLNKTYFFSQISKVNSYSGTTDTP